LRRGSQNPAGAAGERAVGRAGAGVPGVRSRLKPLLQIQGWRGVAWLPLTLLLQETYGKRPAPLPLGRCGPTGAAG
jgi:hypothetical protein